MYDNKGKNSFSLSYQNISFWPFFMPLLPLSPPPLVPDLCPPSGLQGDLLNPCRCDGSVRYTHQHCLLKWISERGCWTCELCCYRFHVIAINMKRPWQVESLLIGCFFLKLLLPLDDNSWFSQVSVCLLLQNSVRLFDDDDVTCERKHKFSFSMMSHY